MGITPPIQITLTPAWPARGKTVTTNAATKPEISDLINLLKAIAIVRNTEVNEGHIFD